jgi:SecD/SecF fusion protein
VTIVRKRLAALKPGLGFEARAVGDFVIVDLPGLSPSQDHLAELVGVISATARLEFYDWEANVLAPSGKLVADLLKTQDQNAMRISQAAGSPLQGSLGLYQAVKLASKQPAQPSKANSRDGPEYYIFGTPKSDPCTMFAKAHHITPVVGQPCYLAGPEDTKSSLNDDLQAEHLSPSDGKILTVQQGWVVDEAAYPHYGHQPPVYDPTAQFFVLRDRVALFGNNITNPQQSTDQAGQPDVSFGFNGPGGQAFQNMTAEIAKRGELVSGRGQKLFQHFAVALDTQLVTVPYIDFGANPDGIPANNGADIQGGFTLTTARALATELRLGQLPIPLQLIRLEQIPPKGT